jgi:hypothetical protein
LDKHSSLLQKFVNCERKKFYNIGPWVQGLHFVNESDRLDEVVLAEVAAANRGHWVSFEAGSELAVFQHSGPNVIKHFMAVIY